MTFRKMSAEELRLAKMWYEEDGMTRSEIADLLRRDKSTITRGQHTCTQSSVLARNLNVAL